MSIRYLGSKARLAEAILDVVGEPNPDARFVDAFCGTGTVSVVAALRGWKIRANDLLPSSATLTRAQLATSEEARFADFGSYRSAIEALNQTPETEGFFFREYAPSGHSRSGNVRRYFTPENARKLDGIRARIRDWNEEGKLTPIEHTLLLADLIESTNAVANTAGTYGCFLRRYAPNALKPIVLSARDLPSVGPDCEVTVGNAGEIRCDIGDVVYLDPPYTKRQYSAYYHILETLVAEDEPVVEGVTGLRPWRDRSSDFCHKKRALDALALVVENTGGARVLISYSDQGHIPLATLATRLSEFGNVVVHELGRIGRYAPNEQSRANGRAVSEVLIEWRRQAPGRPRAGEA